MAYGWLALYEPCRCEMRYINVGLCGLYACDMLTTIGRLFTIRLMSQDGADKEARRE